MFPKTVLNDIKDRVSIVAYIGERIPLKRAGRNFRGLCPFHQEKTPSFNVSDDKGIYHCFGCGEGGDLFQFVMKFEGLPFAEAVRTLAVRAGIELPRNIAPEVVAAEEESVRHKRLLYRVNEIARDWFCARLMDSHGGAGARAYLQRRGISQEISTQHFLGFADNSWDALSAQLKDKGVPLELAAELGLLKRRDGGGYYDFFRNRIIFPIVSMRGEVLGFSGRTLEVGGETAKYLNSPDSLIYHKSTCVYGLNRAAGAIRSEDQVLLVEGNIDLIALHQAGMAQTVAPLGTALTAGHVRLLARQTRNMVVIFDGDAAGVRAAVRSLEIFFEEGLSPRVVPLPAGEDPDSLVRKEGGDAFRRRIAAAPPLFEYVIDRVLSETGADAAGAVAATGRILPLIRIVKDPAARAVYLRSVARRLDLDPQALQRSLNEGGGRPRAAADDARAPHPVVPRGPVGARSIERTIVELLLSRPELAEESMGVIDPERFEDAWCKAAVQLLMECWQREGRIRIDDFVEGIGDPEFAVQLRQLSIEGGPWENEEAPHLLRDCLRLLAERPAAQRFEQINDDIRRAEAEGDEARTMELLVEKASLAVQIKRQGNAAG